jgi:hypothetical protein
MWFSYPDEPSKFYELSLDRVKEIVELNQNGRIPSDLEDFVEIPELDNAEPDYENVVGQDSLTRFDHKNKKNKRRSKGRSKRNPKAGPSNKPQNKRRPTNKNKQSNKQGESPKKPVKPKKKPNTGERAKPQMKKSNQNPNKSD